MGKNTAKKKAAKKNAEQTARRELARAQLKFHVAQEKQVQARARGKGEVERARLKAARWLAKAAQGVERCSEEVASAEARLRELVRDGSHRTSTHDRGDSITSLSTRPSPNGDVRLLDAFENDREEDSRDAESIVSDGSGEPLWQG